MGWTLFIICACFYFRDIFKRDAQIKKLTKENTALKAILSHAKILPSNQIQTIDELLQISQHIEKDFREKFNFSDIYLDIIFRYVNAEIQKSHKNILSCAVDSKVQPKAILYFIIFTKTSSLLKYADGIYVYRGMLSTQGQSLFNMWVHTLEKLKEEKFLDNIAAQQETQSMHEWMKTNG